MMNFNLNNYNSVDLPDFDLSDLSDLALSCVVMAMDMSDNGLSWAPADDLLDCLADLDADGGNVNDVASAMADVANWYN